MGSFGGGVILMSAHTSGRGQQAQSPSLVLQQVVPSGQAWLESHGTYPTLFWWWITGGTLRYPGHRAPGIKTGASSQITGGAFGAAVGVVFTAHCLGEGSGNISLRIIDP